MLPLFDDEPEPEVTVHERVMMSEPQRAEIRDLFGELGIRTAREQFQYVEEATRIRIASVGELDGATAHRLLIRLRARVANKDRVSTGNSWDDREDDTWIDKL